MPRAAPRPCTQHGCHNLAYTGSRCEEHPREATNWGAWQADKGTSTDRGYGAGWRKIRERILKRDHYLCQSCAREGFIMSGGTVDHIIPKAQGGTDEDHNLEVICSDCHKAKTARESGGSTKGST